MPLTLSRTGKLTPNYQKTAGLAGGIALVYGPSLSDTFSLTSGTGAGQADQLYAGTRTLAASVSEDVDLAGGLTDVFGVALTFVKVKYIYIKAALANVNTVIVGGATSNQFVGPFGAATHTQVIQPGASLEFMHPGAGWTVTAATGDLLKVLNGGAGTSVTYDLVIAGTSA